jgi:hypothetical protein
VVIAATPIAARPGWYVNDAVMIKFLRFCVFQV